MLTKETFESIKQTLTERQIIVLENRFQDNETLQAIGDKWTLSRERVRQIQEQCLKAIYRRLDMDYREFIDGLQSLMLLKQAITEKELIETVSKNWEIDPIQASIYIHACRNRIWLIKGKLSQARYNTYFRTESISDQDIERILDEVIQFYLGFGDYFPAKKLKRSESLLRISKELHENNKLFGLTKWIPRNLNDKCYAILKKYSKPLHFVEISNKVIEEEFDKKTINIQSVHNVLMRDDRFVLVGRGTYALREWGYKDGTVSDVIERILQKSKKPLHKKEIVKEVLKVRQVKQGTISLNLQKNSKFVRVGRAIYQLNQ